MPKVLIVALVTFFPITVSLLQGFGTTPARGDQPAALDGREQCSAVSAVPGPDRVAVLLLRVRIAITYAMIGAIFGEYVGAEKGLGIYMHLSKNAPRTDLVLAAVAVNAMISLALYFFVASIAWDAVEAAARAERGDNAMTTTMNDVDQHPGIEVRHLQVLRTNDGHSTSSTAST